MLRSFSHRIRAAHAVSRRSAASAAAAPAVTLPPSTGSQHLIPLHQHTYSSTVKDALRQAPAAKITKLSNGVRVATEYMPGETATFGVWWDTGSRYETDNNNGVAHFLEHMFFKGTKRRTVHELEVEIENMGAHLNAYTSRETTTFYAKTFKNDIRQGMDILADILRNSVIHEDLVEREKDTILRESQEVEKNMEEVVFDRLHETAYRETSMARTILGSEDNIKQMTRDMLLDYRASMFIGPRLVIAGAGPFEHEEFVKLASELYSGVPTTPTNNKPLELVPAKFTGSSIRLRFDDMDQCHVALAWPTAGWGDGDNFTLMVIQALLGSYDSSAPNPSTYSYSGLVNAYNTEGLGKGFNTFNCQYSDTGLFGVYYQGYATRMQRASWYVLEEIRRLAYNIDEKALHNAKASLISSLCTALDGSTVRCEDVGRQVLTLGRRIHPLEAIQRVENVKISDIQAVAKRYFWDRDFAIAAIGPTWELPDYLWMRRRTYAARF
jgi:processing peptidase subunit beta